MLDIGCGTGLNFSLIREAIGPAGRIVGVGASANMLAQARAKAERRGWMNIGLEDADANRSRLPTLTQPSNVTWSQST